MRYVHAQFFSGVLAVTSLLSLLACGHAEPGSGTHDVKVVLDVHSIWNEPNARITFCLQDESEQVLDDARVLLAIEGGPKACWPSGSFASAVPMPFAPSHISLRISEGPRRVSFGAEGPSPHRVVSPSSGARHPRDTPLVLKWEVDDGRRADSIEVVALAENEQLATSSKDTGRCVLAPSSLSLGVQTLRITRIKVLVPEGGCDGSRVTLRYSADVTVTLF